jgi:hypothetical protein
MKEEVQEGGKGFNCSHLPWLQARAAPPALLREWWVGPSNMCLATGRKGGTAGAPYRSFTGAPQALNFFTGETAEPIPFRLPLEGGPERNRDEQDDALPFRRSTGP